MGHLPLSRHSDSGPRGARRPSGTPGLSSHHPAATGRGWRRTAIVAGLASLATLVLPAAASTAAPRQPMPTLKDLVAQARLLSNQINALDEQYNGLRIQLSEARAEQQVAQRTYADDLLRLSAGKLSIGQLAAQSYMNVGLGTSMTMLTINPATRTCPARTSPPKTVPVWKSFLPRWFRFRPPLTPLPTS